MKHAPLAPLTIDFEKCRTLLSSEPDWARDESIYWFIGKNIDYTTAARVSGFKPDVRCSLESAMGEVKAAYHKLKTSANRGELSRTMFEDDDGCYY